MFDQLGRVSYFVLFFFLIPPPLTAVKRGFSPRLQRLGEVDVTGRCLLTRFIKTDWKHGIPLWSRPTPETCPSHARPGSSACAGGGGRDPPERWRTKILGPVQCKKEGCGYRSVFDPSQDAQTMALLCPPLAFNAHFCISNRNFWILAARSSLVINIRSQAM